MTSRHQHHLGENQRHCDPSQFHPRRGGNNVEHKSNAAHSDSDDDGAPISFLNATLHEYNEELFEANLDLQNMIRMLGAAPDDSSSEAAQEYRLNLEFLLEENRRRHQQAQRMFGVPNLHGVQGGELMVCGDNGEDALGLHKSHFADDEDQTAVLPKLNDYAATKHLRAVAAGGMHSVVLNMHGMVYTWGGSQHGVLGRELWRAVPPNADVKLLDELDIDKNDIVDGMFPTDGRPTRVVGFSSFDPKEDERILQIAAGEGFTLFLAGSGNLYISGYMRDINGTKHLFSTPVMETEADREAYEDSTLLFDNPGARLVLIPGMDQYDIVHIAASCDHAAVITKDGTLLTFGFGNFFELSRSLHLGKQDEKGDFTLNPRLLKAGKTDDEYRSFIKEEFLKPLPVQWSDQSPKIQRTVVAVGLGEHHILVAARDEGELTTRVYACGQNQLGQLGLGDTADRYLLTRVPFFDTLNIAQFACGQNFSHALSMDGKALYAFGRSDAGALGIGYVPCARDPVSNSVVKTCEMCPVRVRLPFTSPIVGLSAGAHHCLAVTEDGNAYGWGSKESFRTGVSEYRVYTGPLEYGVGEGPTEYVSFPDEDVYAPMLLRLADHCGPETERVHVHAAGAGGIHSLFLVQRVASAVGLEALKQWQQQQDQNSQAHMEEDAGATSDRPTKRARVL